MRYNRANDRYDAITWDEAFKPSSASTLARRWKSPGQSDLLHLGPHQQRGRVPVPTLRPPLRHEQPARLLEHVPREQRPPRWFPPIGVGKGTVTLEDFEHADAIFVIGQNPGTNHPRMLGGTGERLRNAGRRSSRSTHYANPAWFRFTHPKHPLRHAAPPRHNDQFTHYYQVQVGGDLAALTGMCKYLLEENAAIV